MSLKKSCEMLSPDHYSLRHSYLSSTFPKYLLLSNLLYHCFVLLLLFLKQCTSLGTRLLLLLSPALFFFPLSLLHFLTLHPTPPSVISALCPGQLITLLRSAPTLMSLID
uniref:Uncharacterized protein n=1 Tax=Periophthalmus magnuspinnatus TaxID=409849 RepID=A0A3B4A727_9GOBI